MIALRALIFVAAVAALVACTPTHNVKPLPNFVEAGLAPGDKVVVHTRDGRQTRFVITRIEGTQIHGEGHQFDLSDVSRIEKLAWKRPPSPCGGDKPLGCSVPWLLRLASPDDDYYVDQFHDACADHDYCYRHGYKTYGVERESCDERFLQNMLDTCPSAPQGILSKTLDILNNAVQSRSRCIATAKNFHGAVRRYGDKHYQAETGTYCEYDGPVVAP